MSRSLYRLPLSKLEAFDRASVVTDADLAALGSEKLSVDEGLRDVLSADTCAYILKQEGRIRQEHQEISVGYVTPKTLRDRCPQFEAADIAAIHKELSDDGIDLDYLRTCLESLRRYTRQTVDRDLGLLIVDTY
jgi:hypothetical protein